MRAPRIPTPSLRLLGSLCALGLGSALHAADVQFVALSDVHFGYIRVYPLTISGTATQDAKTINTALIGTVNALSTLAVPADGGVGAGAPVGAVDFVAVTGDIANRYQTDSAASGPSPANLNAVQNATASYADFTSIVLNGVTLKNKTGAAAKFLLSPGNHDVSNAIGNQKIPGSSATGAPATPNRVDAGSMKALYKVAKGIDYVGTYDLAAFETTNASGAAINKPNYSMDVGGIHMISVTIWPDDSNRKWIDADLASVPLTTPVMLFMHDYPDVDTKHMKSRAAGNPINVNFEAVATVVVDASESADGIVAATNSNVEQRAFVAWLKTHKNIVAYFHGHSNSNEMWDYKGPDADITLKCFRIDSSMKGDISASAAGKENLLSYLLTSIDTTAKKMTVREIRWYPTPVFSTDVTTAANARSPAVANVPKLDWTYQVAAPTFSVAGGTYSSTQMVTLASPTSGTDIYYTTDGSSPTPTSTKYTAPLSIASTTTVKAIAVPTAFTSQAPNGASAAYTIQAEDKDSNGCGKGSGLVTLFGALIGFWLVGRRLR
jgi:hypothetical protein